MNIILKSIAISLLFSYCLDPLCAQGAGASTKPSEDLNLNQQLTEISETNILSNSDYYVWGGSVVQGEDKKFYMFYARWPKGYIGRTQKDSWRYMRHSFW